MIRLFASKEFFAFLITGGVAAIVNFTSRVIYNQWIDFSSAIIIAYITGMITAFILARIFVFKGSQQALHHSAFYFTLVNLLAVAQTWVISMLLANYILPGLGISRFTKELAHAVGIAVPVFTSYLGHKHLSFR